MAIIENPKKSLAKYADEIIKYIFVKRLEDNKSVSVSINDDTIEDALKYQGYTVYFSSRDIDIMSCYRHYICRNAV